MGIEKGQVHRSGDFKQSNKEHKHGRHRSKGSVSVATKGKVSLKALSKKHKHELNRDQRRHQAVQLRQKKRGEVLAKKRMLGGMDMAPIFVSVIPLNQQFDPTTALSILTQCDEEAVVKTTSTGVTHLCLNRFKKRYSFIVPSTNRDMDILDTLKVSDTVMFLLSSVCATDNIEDIIDKWGNNILMSALAQGLPTPIIVLSDLESVAPKKRNEFKQAVQKIIARVLPEEKIMCLDKNCEGINILRKIGEQKRKPVLYRDRRPYIYGEELEYCPNNEGTFGTLKLTGYLKGTTLSVNQLVHIPGLGDYQMSQIDAPSDPNNFTKNKATDSDEMPLGTVIKILDRADPDKQETLDSENIPDPMDAEQTWPNEDDYEIGEKEQMKKAKKIPKGWSDYQAAWIPEDDIEFHASGSSDDDEEEGSEDEFMDAQSEEYSDANSDDKEFDTVTESEGAPNDDQYDQQIDMTAEHEDFRKLKEAKSDLVFPDEVDTPVDTPARIRFQKYRGLESFRTSAWDFKENLPSDYSRIYQFQNFDRTKKRVLKAEENKTGTLPGWYVTVHIKNVSQLMWEAFEKSKSPAVLIGLFPHEHKMSVLNTVLKRTQNYGFPIKSKERVIFQCGFRRFIVNPVFSQHTNGQKYKFERFFQPNSTAVATFYAPIQFPPAPVLCYKEVGSNLILVATGNLLSCNPDRLVIKRVVLSGHPYKIFKRSAVIRFMFFNRDDIKYFQPCKLRTKMGRIGHIKEPLGTHGHMKCVFDGQLKSQDTVTLNLYKRVFPKWTYEDMLVNCLNNEQMES